MNSYTKNRIFIFIDCLLKNRLILKPVYRYLFVFIFALNLIQPAYSQCTTTFPGGSFIINMGVTPQTTANGLKPYGMLYDLIVNYGVPIVWCIDPGKSKDGPDFNYNWTDYSGGSFVVPAQYITPAVAGRITAWLTAGVQGTYAIAGSFSPIAYDTLTSFPKVMIDNGSGNQNIITSYYVNAGIPSSAYILGIPSTLTGCYDIWTNPHDDPTWATHGYLHNFVTNFKGNIFAQCHEVSMMENVSNPVSPFQKLNFLTQTGLQCYSATKCGAAPAHPAAPHLPITYSNHSDPIMQFMGTIYTPTQQGSEKWYKPLTGGGWNSNTKRSVITNDGASPNEGVLLVYGPAYNNFANGTVMYIAGHDLDGGATTADKVAAQRAYFNFVLVTGKQKELAVSTTVPASFGSFYSYPVSANVTSGTPPYTFQWSSRMGGTFTNSNSANAVYTAPNVPSDTLEYLKVRVTDACGRVNFQIICVPLLASPLPVKLLSFSVDARESMADAHWCTASEINNDYFTLERSFDAREFEPIANIDGAGNSTAKIDYNYLDRYPLSGLSYYRLKQTDFDGQFSYSDIVAFKYNGKGFIVFPNPASNKVTVLSDRSQREKFAVQLIDISGRIVMKQEVQFDDSELNKFEFDVSEYSRGIYTLVCTSDHTNYVEQLIIK